MIFERIVLSKDTFTKMKSIITNRIIRIYTKINTLKAYIIIVLKQQKCGAPEE